jgi:hypothetical protein
MSRDYQTLFPRPFPIPARPEIRTARATPDRDELRWVLENAALAPSGGNFQPWKFAWDGARLRCLFDEERTHYFTNYHHCETHVSLGAAVTNIEGAASAELQSPSAGGTVGVGRNTITINSWVQDAVKVEYSSGHRVWSEQT